MVIMNQTSYNTKTWYYLINEYQLVSLISEWMDISYMYNQLQKHNSISIILMEE